jgi:hypothetical protein
MIGIYNLPSFFLDFGVRIVHMLLMSWAAEGTEFGCGNERVVIKPLDCGVEHNVLLNPEIRNVVLVDFERSAILKPDTDSPGDIA